MVTDVLSFWMRGAHWWAAADSTAQPREAPGTAVVDATQADSSDATKPYRLVTGPFAGYGLQVADMPDKMVAILCDNGEEHIYSCQDIKDAPLESANFRIASADNFKAELLRRVPLKDRDHVCNQAKKHIIPHMSSPLQQDDTTPSITMTPQLCLDVLTAKADPSLDIVAQLTKVDTLNNVRNRASSVRAFRLYEHLGEQETFRTEWERPRFETASWRDISGLTAKDARESVKYGCIIERSGYSQLAYLPNDTWKRHWRTISILAHFDDSFRKLITQPPPPAEKRRSSRKRK